MKISGKDLSEGRDKPIQETINIMSWKDFMDNGYLHELNRLFLHPVGLALVVIVDDSMKPTGQIFIHDNRGEGGPVFNTLDRLKMDKFSSLAFKAKKIRSAKLGWEIQTESLEE